MRKKGIITIQQITMYIILLVILGLILVIGLKVQVGVKTSIVETETTEFGDSHAIINETLTINHTGSTLINYLSSGLPSASSPSGLVFTNATYDPANPGTWLVYEAGNFTVDGASVSLLAVGAVNASSDINQTKVNISYNFNFNKGTADYNASVDVQEGVENISGQQSLLGTIIVFGAILSLVITAFMLKQIVS